MHQLAVEPRGEQLGMFTKLKAEDLEKDAVALESVTAVAEGQFPAEMPKPPLPRADAKPLLQRDLPPPVSIDGGSGQFALASQYLCPVLVRA